MIPANIEQKNLVVGILVDAFKDNQSVNYIVRQDKHRLRRIEALMDYSFEICHKFGRVWLSENREACALILYPHLKRFSLLAIWLDIKLIFQAVGISGIFKALKREALIKKVKPKIPMTYIWFIGVNPYCHHAGHGSVLLSDLLSASEKEGLPVYLETSTLNNLPWYKRFGFEIYDQLIIGYTLFFLKRSPNKH
ncbi:MAG TPA: N-acetyltransferase [Mucilaginibacter sp.]|jgi:ribosomal protein S18 acetylase RimI-like enzyme